MKFYPILLCVLLGGVNSQGNYEYTGSMFVTSEANNCLCLTRDSSGDNRSLRLILHDYCAFRRNTPRASRWKPKLEIAKMKGTDAYQFSQGYRGKGNPHGLAGCLAPTNSELVFGECNSVDSLWRFESMGNNQFQLYHGKTSKCLQAGNDQTSVSLVKCDKNDSKQKWNIEIEKD